MKPFRAWWHARVSGHYFQITPSRGSYRGRTALPPLFICECGEAWNPRQRPDEGGYAPTAKDTFAPYHWVGAMKMEGVNAY